MKKIVIFLSVVLCTTFSSMFILNGCTAQVLNKRLPTEFNDFIKSAKELLSAIEIGLNYEQYGEILIKLNMVANNALEKLSSYPDTQKRIKSVMGYFVSARTLWSIDIKHNNIILSPDFDIAQEIFEPYFNRYPFLVGNITDVRWVAGQNFTVYSPKKAIQLLWARAAVEIGNLK